MSSKFDESKRSINTERKKKSKTRTRSKVSSASFNDSSRSKTKAYIRDARVQHNIQEDHAIQSVAHTSNQNERVDIKKMNILPDA